MDALIIYETMFGNTRQVAEAIADGLSGRANVAITEVTDAPSAIPSTVDLLIVGGPTHAFSMSRVTTRQDAVNRGATGTDLSRGIREWLAALSDGAHPQAFAAFDTRVDIPLLPGAASRSATKVAERLGFAVLHPASYLVKGYEGPVVDGELDRARIWGEHLADEMVEVRGTRNRP